MKQYINCFKKTNYNTIFHQPFLSSNKRFPASVSINGTTPQRAQIGNTPYTLKYIHAHMWYMLRIRIITIISADYSK